jgi:hypothetical protein
MHKVVYVCSQTVMEKIIVAYALACLFGCGAKSWGGGHNR